MDDLITTHRYTAPASPLPPQLDDSGLLTSEPTAFENEREEAVHVVRPKPVIVNISLHHDGSIAASWYLVYHITALSIIPKTIDGRETCVVLLDCTGRFSARLFNRQVQAMLARTNKVRPPDTVQEAALTALSHVHVVKCSSFASLLTSLRELPAQLLSGSHPSSARSLSSLFVMGINAFQWQTRAQVEMARLENEETPPVANSLIISELKRLQDRFSCNLFYTSSTNSTSLNSNTSRRGPAETPSMDVFSQYALINLHPSRSSTLEFAAGLTIDACLLDKMNRQSAVRSANQLYHWSTTPGGQSTCRRSDQAQSTSSFEMRVLRGGGLDFDIVEW